MPNADEAVAAGACVQAAAVLAGTPPLQVAQRWDLGSGTTVEPAGHVDAEATRRAYDRAADAAQRLAGD